MSASDTPVDYQALFRALPDNFMLMAPDATVLDNTDAHVAASLKPRAEVLGKSMFEAFPSVDQNEGDVIQQSHEHVRQHRAPHVMPLIRYDLALPAEQGGGFEEMYWQATHYPVLGPDGELLYLLQRTQNVTEQHRAALRAAQVQRELDEAQERTRFILENLPVLIWTADSRGQRDYFNTRWLSYTGRPLAEQTGRQWADGIHPDDRERVLAAWQHAVDTGEHYQVEYRLRRHDGQYRWLLMRAVPRRDAAGTISMWVGAGSDIHEQRLMVQELLEANEHQAQLADQAAEALGQARQQQHTYQTLFTQAPAMIAITRGPAHHYEFVNPRYQELFPGRQLLHRDLLDAVPEIRDQPIMDVLNQVYRSGEPFHGKELNVPLDRDGSGQLRDSYFNFVYQRLREPGKPDGVMVFGFEVTELVQARQALEKMRNEAGQGLPDASRA